MRRHARVLVVAVAAVGCAVGCAEEIDTRYGARSGVGSAGSVNGTAVLADLFDQARHSVSAITWLSPRIRTSADCIVWFPDHFGVPSRDVILWFENWLAVYPNRTLIYVGRDYDAAPGYWRAAAASAPADARPEYERELNYASALSQEQRRALVDGGSCEWFQVRDKVEREEVRSLHGAWADKVDQEKVGIELSSTLDPPMNAELLLSYGFDVIVSKQRRGLGNVIVVSNGSFLLNLPLVNREHRKLAGALIAEIGPPSQDVMFLESGPEGPTVHEREPNNNPRTGLDMLGLQPFHWVALHVMVLGVLFCVARWPVFGLGRTPPAESASDFGQHVWALGEMLGYTGDRQGAHARVELYIQQTRREHAGRRPGGPLRRKF